jgi:hypothetical protein
MIAPLHRIFGNVRHRAVDKTIANGIEHRLMLGHGVDNAFRILGTAE